MKLKTFIISIITFLCIFSTSCATFDKYQEQAEEKVLLYLRENGTEKTDKYIDKLVVEGKLTEYQAIKLKDIIHSALAKVEEVLAEKVEESKTEK
ncbi:MAG: hypothetical protein PHW93_07435 [Candidatus Methanomethylophilaceae archaeon]|nr:hypothetical protein [Candidatus Methanomethylophilaceae archaeon]